MLTLGGEGVGMHTNDPLPSNNTSSLAPPQHGSPAMPQHPAAMLTLGGKA